MLLKKTKFMQLKFSIRIIVKVFASNNAGVR